MRYIVGDEVDELFARISASGTTAWYLTDRLGSVRNITDNTGSVIDTMTYDVESYSGSLDPVARSAEQE